MRILAGLFSQILCNPFKSKAMTNFIQLGSGLLINPQTITYIDKMPAGVKIHFIGGGSIEINISLDQLISQIKNNE